MEARKISRFVTMGDSLSDRGTLYRRYLLGFIPMSWVSGLKGASPQGRFTNGLAWSDHIIAMFSSAFIINELKNPPNPAEKSANFDALDLAGDKKSKHGWDASDIADAVSRHYENGVSFIQSSYSLKDDLTISYKGENLVRNYNEGGLTSFDWSWVINSIMSWTRSSLRLFFSCLILATLGEKRSQLLADDERLGLSKQHKAETLVIEWSGGNDLITAHARPTRVAADRAVAARMSNIKELMKNGYQHFIWFNLPNLALTPRYKAKSQAEQDNAQDCTEYFNRELEKAYKELSINYPHCSIELFDVNAIFTRIYHNPEVYNFDQALLTEPCVQPGARINPGSTAPATGRMFWDEIHPSADLHAIIAARFYRKFSMNYHFSPPQDDAVEAKIDVSEDALLRAYRNVQGSQISRERNALFRGARPAAQAQHALDLDGILTRALHGGDRRALSVMKELHWFNEQGELNLNIPVLKKAIRRVHEAQNAVQIEGIERDDPRVPLVSAR